MTGSERAMESRDSSSVTTSRLIRQLFATTHPVGTDRLSKGALEGMLSQIRKTPIPLNVEHLPGVNPIGWVMDGEVVQLADGEWGLLSTTALLGANEFVHPSMLKPPRSSSIAVGKLDHLQIDVEPRDLDVESIERLSQSVGGSLTIRAGERHQWSAVPPAVIFISVVAIPFVAQLAKRLADDSYDSLKRGIFGLKNQLLRKVEATFYVFHYTDRRGRQIELVVVDSSDAAIEGAWDHIDSGLDAGRAFIAGNPSLKKICLQWDAALGQEGAWGVRYAITNDLKVVAEVALAGISSGEGGVRVRRIDVPSPRHDRRGGKGRLRRVQK